MNMEAIGNRLKILRKAIGRSQTDMAKLCNVSKQAWGKWENGTRQISLQHLLDVSRATSTSLDWIAEGKGLPPNA